MSGYIQQFLLSLHIFNTYWVQFVHLFSGQLYMETHWAKQHIKYLCLHFTSACIWEPSWQVFWAPCEVQYICIDGRICNRRNILHWARVHVNWWMWAVSVPLHISQKLSDCLGVWIIFKISKYAFIHLLIWLKDALQIFDGKHTESQFCLSSVNLYNNVSFELYIIQD